MPVLSAKATERLRAIPNLTILFHEPLAPYTRFALGGPAAVFCDTHNAGAFAEALHLVNTLTLPHLVIGGGTNLVVSDDGYEGIVLRFRGKRMIENGTVLCVEAGVMLQDVVDRSIALGLAGMESMTGIPGYLGGAVYGNAGAYGRSMQELVEHVCFTDGERIRTFNNEECQFRYRESIFKDHKGWIVLSADLRFTPGDPEALAKTAGEIRAIRDAKYPPTMKCAGSIFKNVFFADLPASVGAQVPAKLVREGKVPSAWFLEEAGVKGMTRGDIHVATYHANLIYNGGNGRAVDLVALIEEAKRRVRERFGFDLQEEVQYVGFEYAETPA
ncbi:MAG: UDP-N-acetylmuramate dehydrogenase [Acidobacteriaceae bacterium]|nr:UDP-N-acetylmuramate dehydrogenase [Acidobacteriaceae bacterium]